MSEYVYVVRRYDGDFVDPALMGVYNNEAEARAERGRQGADSWVECWLTNGSTAWSY